MPAPNFSDVTELCSPGCSSSQSSAFGTLSGARSRTNLLRISLFCGYLQCRLLYSQHPLTTPSPLFPPSHYKKTSILISNVLTGYFNSNFSNTLGCKMPKVPITCSFPPILKWILAACPGKNVLSSTSLIQYAHFSASSFFVSPSSLVMNALLSMSIMRSRSPCTISKPLVFPSQAAAKWRSFRDLRSRSGALKATSLTSKMRIGTL